jgi:RNA-binding protein
MNYVLLNHAKNIQTLASGTYREFLVYFARTAKQSNNLERKSPMLNSKQRAHLRGLANSLEPIFQVGKSALSPELSAGIDEALEARELVKLSVLNNCAEEPKEIAETLAGRTRSDVVQVVGRKIVLYRKAKKAAISLP